MNSCAKTTTTTESVDVIVGVLKDLKYADSHIDLLEKVTYASLAPY
jgi:hypothetical protein